MVCYNRPHYLTETLEALTRMRGWGKYPLYISQDGEEPSTKKAALNFKAGQAANLVQYWSHPRNPELGAQQASTAWLAQHYKYALDQSFSRSEHSHLIILEDDMLVSPDFLEYFEQTAWLLDEDPTLWCVSSWNDNAFAHFEWNENSLFRNSFFPGLGWMLTRRLWQNELASRWPLNHWDHWMRSNANGRDCICPEVSRNRNIGANGATVDQQVFERRFARLQFADGLSSNFGDLSYLLLTNYEQQIKTALSTPGIQIHDGNIDMKTWQASRLVLPYMPERFRGLARGLDIWDMPRTHFRGITRLQASGNRQLYLVDVKKGPRWAIPDGYAFTPKPSFTPVLAQQAGIPCSAVCSNIGLKCAPDHFDLLNDCRRLSDFMPTGCRKGCHMEWGTDLPAFVSSTNNYRHGICLLVETTDITNCHGKHPDTLRLCPCV